MMTRKIKSMRLLGSRLASDEKNEDFRIVKNQFIGFNFLFDNFTLIFTLFSGAFSD